MRSVIGMRLHSHIFLFSSSERTITIGAHWMKLLKKHLTVCFIRIVNHGDMEATKF